MLSERVDCDTYVNMILIFNYLLVKIFFFLNNLLVKILKNRYFKNIHRDEFNNIIYDIICLYISKKI